MRWHVVAFTFGARGEYTRCLGTCGHSHQTKLAAVRCNWEPPGWRHLVRCDLVVREMR